MLGKDYHDYIGSQRWKMRCKVYWDTQGRWCRGCRSTQNLKVHHLSYDNFGFEPMSDLMGLCQKCHLEVHKRHRAGGRRESIRTVTIKYVREMALNRLRRKNT